MWRTTKPQAARADRRGPADDLWLEIETAVRVGRYRVARLIDRVSKQIPPDMFMNEFPSVILNSRSARYDARVRPAGILADIGVRDQAAGVSEGGRYAVDINNWAVLSQSEHLP